MKASIKSTLERMGLNVPPRAQHSWGVETDPCLVLQVWQHHTKWIDGQSFVRVTYRSECLPRGDGCWTRKLDGKVVNGMKERENQIAGISADLPVIGLMLKGVSRVDDESNIESSISDHNTKAVFALDPSGAVKIEDDLYFPVTERIKTAQFQVWLDLK